MRFKAEAYLACLSLFAILACENPDDNNIEQARQCLDNASQLAVNAPAQAAAVAQNNCEPLIQNINTPEAGSVGVGIVLVEEQKLSSLTSIQNAISQGTGAVATSVSFLVFSSQTHITNITTYAQRSADGNENELASMISLAYLASNAFGGGGLNSSSTPANVQTALTNLAGDPVNGPIAAAALLQAQASACSGSGATSTLCTDLTKAIGSNTSSYSAILSSAANYVGNGG